MYYSTPVYQFRFKCHLCPNYIIMKTDPGVFRQKRILWITNI